jgi:hypothetical protein
MAKTQQAFDQQTEREAAFFNKLLYKKMPW